MGNSFENPIKEGEELERAFFGSVKAKYEAMKSLEKLPEEYFVKIETAIHNTELLQPSENSPLKPEKPFAFDLRKAGLIEATRGKNGGYILKKAANEITLKDVLEALEGPIAIMHCLVHEPEDQACAREHSCSMKKGLGFINEIILKALNQTNLTQLIHSS